MCIEDNRTYAQILEGIAARLDEVADTAAGVGQPGISAELREAAETIRRLKARGTFGATILAETDAEGHNPDGGVSDFIQSRRYCLDDLFGGAKVPGVHAALLATPDSTARGPTGAATCRDEFLVQKLDGHPFADGFGKFQRIPVREPHASVRRGFGHLARFRGPVDAVALFRQANPY